VLLDLSRVTSVEVNLAWGLTEVIQAVRGAEVAVAVGSDPVLEPLRRVCDLEGIALDVAGTAPAATPRADAKGGADAGVPRRSR
jgi:hypothetical protein